MFKYFKGNHHKALGDPEFYFLFNAYASVLYSRCSSSFVDKHKYMLTDKEFNCNIEGLDNKVKFSPNTFTTFVNMCFENFSNGKILPLSEIDELVETDINYVKQYASNNHIVVMPLVYSLFATSEIIFSNVNEISDNKSLSTLAIETLRRYDLNIANYFKGYGKDFSYRAIDLLFNNEIVVDKILDFIKIKSPVNNTTDVEALWGALKTPFFNSIQKDAIRRKSSIGFELILNKLDIFMKTPEGYEALNGLKSADTIKDSEGKSVKTSDIDLVNSKNITDSDKSEKNFMKNFMEFAALNNEISSCCLTLQRDVNYGGVSKKESVRIGNSFEIFQVMNLRDTLKPLSNSSAIIDSMIVKVQDTHTDIIKAKIAHLAWLLEKVVDLARNPNIDFYSASNLTESLIKLESQAPNLKPSIAILQDYVVNKEGKEVSVDKNRLANDAGVTYSARKRAEIIWRACIKYISLVTYLDKQGKYKLYEIHSLAGSKRMEISSFSSLEDYLLIEEPAEKIKEEKIKLESCAFVTKENKIQMPNLSILNNTKFKDINYDIMNSIIISNKFKDSRQITFLRTAQEYFKYSLDVIDEELNRVYYGDLDRGIYGLKVSRSTDKFKDMSPLEKVQELETLARSNNRLEDVYSFCKSLENLVLRLYGDRIFSKLESEFGKENVSNLKTAVNNFLSQIKRLKIARSEKTGRLGFIETGDTFIGLRAFKENFPGGKKILIDHYEFGLKLLINMFLKSTSLVFSLYEVVKSLTRYKQSNIGIIDSVEQYDEVFRYEFIKNGSNHIKLSDFKIKITDETSSNLKVYKIESANERLRNKYRTIPVLGFKEIIALSRDKSSFNSNVIDADVILNSNNNLDDSDEIRDREVSIRNSNSALNYLVNTFNRVLDGVRKTEENYIRYCSDMNIVSENTIDLINKNLRESLNIITNNDIRNSKMGVPVLFEREPGALGLRNFTNLKSVLTNNAINYKLPIKQWLTDLLYNDYITIQSNPNIDIQSLTDDSGKQRYLAQIKEEIMNPNSNFKLLNQFTGIKSYNFGKNGEGFIINKDIGFLVKCVINSHNFYLHESGYLIYGDKLDRTLLLRPADIIK